jgi:hypothetical protein
MIVSKRVGLALAAGILAAGCSRLPGLQVLSGQDTADTQANRVANNVDLIMADKSGNTNPALLAAADRIEAATGNVDVVEIEQNLNDRSLDIDLIWQLAGNPNSSNMQDQLDYYNSIRRAVELTWQATLRESDHLDRLHIEVLLPQTLNTLDNGPSLYAIRQVIIDIARQDAVDYLAKPHNLDDFIGLVADGKMSFGPPQDSPLYIGTPNHPVFMIPSSDQSQSQSQSQSGSGQ